MSHRKPDTGAIVPAYRPWLTADEFLLHHGLTLAQWYAVLSRRPLALPETLLFAGEMRLRDYRSEICEWTVPRVFLDPLPEDANGSAFIETGRFCELYGLRAEHLLNLGLARRLPTAYRTERLPDAVVLDANDVRLWELSGRAEVGAL